MDDPTYVLFVIIVVFWSMIVAGIFYYVMSFAGWGFIH